MKSHSVVTGKMEAVMNKTIVANQKLFDLHLEYTAKADEYKKEYRTLEGKFALAFGFLPITMDDDTFPYLTDSQQRACQAFWKKTFVIEARKNMEVSKTLAQAYLDAYESRTDK